MDLNRIDGEPMEFELKIFTGFTTLDILEGIRTFMKDQQCEPEQFNDRINFMSMYNDIEWGEEGNTEKCENNSVTVAKLCSQSSARTLVIILGTWSRKEMVRNSL